MDAKPPYDPSGGIRSLFAKNAGQPEGDDDEKLVADNAGKASRQQCFALWLTTPHGHTGVIYGHFSGAPDMDQGQSQIEIAFGGRLKHRGRWSEGEWTATISGKRLTKIYKELLEGKRQDVHCCKDGNDALPYVQSIEIEPLQED